MVNSINKKGKLMGRSSDKWGEKTISMGMPG